MEISDYLVGAVETARDNGYFVDGANLTYTDDGWSAWLYEDDPEHTTLFDVAEIFDTPLEAARACYIAATRLDPVAFVIEG